MSEPDGGEPGRRGRERRGYGAVVYRQRLACVSASDCVAVSSGVGLDVLNNDHDLPVRTLGDGVPDSQTVRWKMDPVRIWQRVPSGNGSASVGTGSSSR